VIFPSRWDEPFGLVPLEAMTQGAPVVATRRGGSAEFLADGGNCLEVTADDPGGVAAAVRRLAGDAALRRRLIEGGRKTAARYTAERLADTLERIHLEAAADA
jgi:glycosyltransferase involved in cell wall biosynthesis